MKYLKSLTVIGVLCFAFGCEGGFVEHDLLDGKMSKASAQQENVVVICVPPSNGNPYLKLAPLGGEMCPQRHIALDWCGLAKQ